MKRNNIYNFIAVIVGFVFVMSGNIALAYSEPVIMGSGTFYPPVQPTPQSPSIDGQIPTTYYNPAVLNSQQTMYPVGNPGSPAQQIDGYIPETHYNAPVITTSVYANTYTNNTTSASAISTVGSNSVGNTQATLVGSWSSPTNTQTNVRFEYGTSATSLNNATGTQVKNNSTGTFTDTISNLIPNTIYYYRAVGQVNGQTSYGALRSFKTQATTSFVNTVHAETVAPIGITTNGSLINTGATQGTNASMVCPSDAVEYTLNYENKTGGHISNAVLVINLPNEVDYDRASVQANYNVNNHTVTVMVGEMEKDQAGIIYLTGRANNRIVGHDITTRIDFTYTKINGVNETVTNYVFHSGRDCTNNLGAFALGAGFFPTTFWGWVLIIILVCTIIYLSRKFFSDRSTQTKHH